MEFTGLETTLIGLVTTGVGGVAMKVWFGDKKMSCKDCNARHELVNEKVKAVEEKQDADREQFHDDLGALEEAQKERAEKDKADHGMILRMLRSMVVHSNISDEKKEEILNDRS